MLNQSPELDYAFAALADPTRRRMLERLSNGSASVSELAGPLSLPAALQHLAVLERGGLVASEKVGRVRTVRLERGALDLVAGWVAARKRRWEHDLDQLAAHLAETPELLDGEQL